MIRKLYDVFLLLKYKDINHIKIFINNGLHLWIVNAIGHYKVF